MDKKRLQELAGLTESAETPRKIRGNFNDKNHLTSLQTPAWKEKKRKQIAKMIYDLAEQEAYEEASMHQGAVTGDAIEQCALDMLSDVKNDITHLIKTEHMRHV